MNGPENARALFVVFALTATAVICTILAADLAYGASPTGIEQAAQKAVADELAPSADRSASTASHRKTKRYKLPVSLAFDITYETAMYSWLYDPDAFWYNAYGCRRYGKYFATCVGEYGGTVYADDFSSSTDWTCDWYQDVWINRKNEVHTRVYEIECY